MTHRELHDSPKSEDPNPTISDRTVQVPVSLIEQWERRVRNIAQMPSTADEMRDFLSQSARSALLSQPTPSATPEFLAYNIVNQIADVYYENIPSEKWVAVRQATNDRLWKWVEQMIAGKQPTPTAAANPYVDSIRAFVDAERTAEPPRIDGLVPGATFTEAATGVRWFVAWVDDRGEWVAVPANNRPRARAEFDPSMIRDVRPPTS